MKCLKEYLLSFKQAKAVIVIRSMMLYVLTAWITLSNRGSMTNRVDKILIVNFTRRL
jgi:hypothetical protein